MNMRTMFGWGVVAIALVLVGEARGEFALREHLGKVWENECVSFALDSSALAAARKGVALKDSEGQSVVYQVDTAGGQPRIWFQANLAPYGAYRCAFASGRASAQTDLVIKEDARGLQLENSLTGIRIHKGLSGGQGPIAGIKLRSGMWTGSSTFEGATISSYEVKVVARGPVFAEAQCRAVFGDNGTWTLRLRIERGEPAVWVEEHFDAPSGGTFNLALGGSGFTPTHMLNRNSRVEQAQVMTSPIGSFTLEPWLRWNSGVRGNWIGLYTPASGSSSDMLVMAALQAASWVDPEWSGQATQVGPRVSGAVQNGMMTFKMPVQGGRRIWLLGALDSSGSEAILQQNNRRVAPPPQQLVLKHGDLPLNRVKDLVLEWDGDDDNHPCVYIRKADVAAMRARMDSDPNELRRWVSQQPIDKYLLEGPIKEFVASGDPRLAKRMAAKGEEYLQICVDYYLTQDYLPCPGTAPHMQSMIVTAINLLDPVLSSDAFTPEARKRVLAKLALMGYVVSSEDYWSPARGYSGFANMTSVVALYRAALGSVLPNHPDSKIWRDKGLNQLRWQVSAWSDPDGGCLEAPHYAMVSLDHMIAGAAMASAAGLADFAYDPRMRKIFEWFTLISTPRDSRARGFRHQPPIGNTYVGELCGISGACAAIWKDRDPDFAAQMQWVFEEGGSFPGLGIGWSFPAMSGYRWMMSQTGITPKPAEFGSALFRKTGVVLRNTMNTDRETYLHLIQGSNHSHYDNDSGSIMMYGKGRALIDDWGYIGMNARQWHSLVSGSGVGQMNVRLSDFGTTASLDHVRGSAGPWERKIVFSKDVDPLGPTYFIMRDSYDAAGSADWRLWLAPRFPDLPESPQDTSVTIQPYGATVSGAEDVDMDIFIREAASLNLTAEDGTQRGACSIRTGGKEWGPYQLTQTRLQATIPAHGAVTALLYPRLKTEPAPKVTWQSDGQVVEVESVAGKDCIFMAAPPRTEDAAASLSPLMPGKADDAFVCSTYCAPGGSTPWLKVNDSGSDMEVTDNNVNARVLFAAGTVAVHPHSDAQPATLAWQSPISGTISVEARLKHLNPGVNKRFPEKSDGVIGELRKGDKTLASVAALSGGPEVTMKTKPFVIRKGELVRLVVLVNNSLWFDMTGIDMIVRDSSGYKCVLSESLQNGGKLANDLPTGHPSAVWWACAGDGDRLDMRLLGRVLEPLPEVEVEDGALACAAENNGFPRLWLKRDKEVSFIEDYLPKNSLMVHPGDLPANLVWRSPVAGTVRAELSVEDVEVCKNPDHKSDGVRFELRQGQDVLAEGAFDDGGSARRRVESISVKRGELLRLIVDKRDNIGYDPTRVNLVIEGGGHRWDAHKDLVRGVKLGNQRGADPAKAVWWVCSGDAPAFDPARLERAPLPELTARDGKIRFRGTVGSLQLRRDRVTLSLGAAGEIRAGKYSLVSDSAATKEFKIEN
jgi:hypothetical protein